MNLTEVQKSLERQFSRELSQGSKRNIVFWYDDEGVFAESIDTLTLENAKIIKVDNNNIQLTMVLHAGNDSVLNPNILMESFLSFAGKTIDIDRLIVTRKRLYCKMGDENIDADMFIERFLT